MKSVRTAAFKRDYKRLPEAHKRLFKNAVRKFNDACDAHIAAPEHYEWPGHLRIKAVTGAQNVMELTWSYRRHDGRATWEWTRIAIRSAQSSKVIDEPVVRWRRLGDHGIFDDP